MQGFAYANPKTVKEALPLLGSSWNEAAVLAGGTDLLSLMKQYVATPARVVNLKNCKDLKGISKASGGIRIGALVSLDELLASKTIETELPSLYEAANNVTSPQIRSMGTVGGDLCQRPRCWYYRNGYGLLAMLDGKSLVIDGENRYHAILGNAGPAYFVSASSFGPALVALGATIKTLSASGPRDIAAAEFFTTPRSENDREIALKPNEVVTEIIVPTGMKNATYEVRQKDALDWPLAAASVALKMNGNSIESAKVVLGHVAPTPWAATGADQMLRGKTISEAVAEEAGKAAVSGAKPLSQNAYKVQLAKVAVKRALLAAAQGRT